MFETNYKKKAEEISNWIVATVKEAGFEKVVVALSGGIDSAVSATLAVRALGKEHVIVILLPYGLLSRLSTLDAKEVARFLEIPNKQVITIDIKKAVDEIFKNDIDALNGIRRGNIMARIRMIHLYDLAKKENALVIGTENKSENYLGYFTRFGDEASDIEPIRSLYKTQVWEMGKYLGIPEQIITKPPSAGLWESQTDEKEFGFSYLEADKVLYHYCEEHLPEEAIIDLGIPEDLVKNVLQWVNKNDFKHHLPKVFTG